MRTGRAGGLCGWVLDSLLGSYPSFSRPGQAGNQSAGSFGLAQVAYRCTTIPGVRIIGIEQAPDSGNSLVLPRRVRAEEPVAEAAIHVLGPLQAGRTEAIVLRVIGPAVIPQEAGARVPRARRSRLCQSFPPQGHSHRRRDRYLAE